MAEVKRTYYDSGALKSECFEINGKIYGEFKSYHNNGQLYEICTFVNGKRNGEYKQYYSNGCELSEDANLKLSEDNFLPQKKDLQIFCSDNSKRKNQSSIDSFGQLSVICVFIDGKINGEYKAYHLNGQLYEIKSYIDGKMHGELKEYYVNGQLYIICSYIDGILNGEYKSYDTNGELVESCVYENGKKLKHN